MFLQPIHSEFMKTVAVLFLVILESVFVVSCSTVGSGGQTVPITTSPSSTHKEKEADRRRWATRVQQTNALNSIGSQPGHFGSTRPLFSW